MAQGEVLEGKLAVAAEQEGEDSKQVEQEKDHRAGTVSGSESTDQPHACRPRFWRRTPCCVASAPILLPQHPETDPNRSKNQAPTQSVELPAVERASREIRGLPVMAVSYS